MLKQLDVEGMFGMGEAREYVVLNFLMGHQSADEMFAYAEAVNPPHIFERYVNECHAGWELGKLIDLRRRGKLT